VVYDSSLEVGVPDAKRNDADVNMTKGRLQRRRAVATVDNDEASTGGVWGVCVWAGDVLASYLLSWS
jgi:hypothetical protein